MVKLTPLDDPDPFGSAQTGGLTPIDDPDPFGGASPGLVPIDDPDPFGSPAAEASTRDDFYDRLISARRDVDPFPDRLTTDFADTRFGQGVRQGVRTASQGLGVAATAMGEDDDLAAAIARTNASTRPSGPGVAELGERVAQAADEAGGGLRGFGAGVVEGTRGMAADPGAAAEFVGQGVGTSAPMIAAGAGGALASSPLGPAGVVVGGLAGSAGATAAMEFGLWLQQAVTEEVQERGGDPLEPGAIRSVLADTEVRERLMGEAGRKGLSQAALQVAIDRATLGVGRVLKGRPVAGATIGTGVQASGEAAEEAGAQYAAVGEVDEAEVAMEALASPGAGAAQTAMLRTIDGANLTQADRESPLPDDLIAKGRKTMDELAGGSEPPAPNVPAGATRLSDVYGEGTTEQVTEPEPLRVYMGAPRVEGEETAPGAQPPSQESEVVEVDPAAPPAESPRRGLAGLFRERGEAAETSAAEEASPAEASIAVEAEAAKVEQAPTDAQKEAGNYRKGHVSLQGLDITIETPRGGERTGTGKDGERWSVTMPAHYGYVRRTEGADGDHVDVYIGGDPDSDQVFVVDQYDPASGKFDEHKVVLGSGSEAEATALYDGGFSDGSGPSRRRGVTPMTMAAFQDWLRDGDQSKPVGRARAAAAQKSEKARTNEPVDPDDPYGFAGKTSLKEVIDHGNAMLKAEPALGTEESFNFAYREARTKAKRAAPAPSSDDAAKLWRLDPTAEDLPAEQVEVATQALRQELDRLGLADVGLRVANRVEVAGRPAVGRYFRQAISVALAGNEQVRATLGHEAMHAFWRLGVLTDTERNVLRSRARSWRRDYAVDDNYRDLGLSEEQLNEEAIAFAFGDHLAGDGRAKGTIARIFKKLSQFLEAVRNWAAGRGLTSAEAVFETMAAGEAGRRQRPSTGRGEQPAAALPSPPDGTEHVRRRQSGLVQAVRDGSPIDKAFRTAFLPMGKINAQGQLQLTEKLPEHVGNAIVGARFSDDGAFSWMNGLLEGARAGLIDNYGLDPEYVARRKQARHEERGILAEVPKLMETLKKEGLSDPASARVLHDVLTGQAVADSDLAKISQPIINAIDEMGQEAVDLGMLSRESYERNRGAYLHRSYARHEGLQGGLVGWVGRQQARARKRVIGDQFKGRGVFEKFSTAAVMRYDQRAANAEKGTPVVGDRYRILERRRLDPEKAFAGIDPGPVRVSDRAIVPADEPIPDQFQGWTDFGEFEVRDTGRGGVTLWRDWTRSEREHMGEIMDARYNITRTYQLMAHDLTTGRLFKDIAENAEWTQAQEPAEGTWKDASDYNRFWANPDIEWVRVPDTTIAGTNAKRYGAMSGKFVRSEIWRDLEESEQWQRPSLWDALVRNWKLNKTARNPVVHTNNVMSNLLFMDMADVRWRDLSRAVRSMATSDKLFEEARDAGAFGTDLVSQEIRRDVLEPIMRQIANETQGKSFLEQRIGRMGTLVDGIFAGIAKADRAMINAYRMEDEIFRLALYARRRDQGLTAKEAAGEAVEQFLDYEINAPWVNAARRSVLPFVAYTYRAVPVIAKSIAHRPWKLPKYFAIAYGLNALSYAFSGGDEDEERRSLREQEQGKTWVGVPRLLRLPFATPTFLDIRRWIPAGDVFDTTQGSSSLPIPAPLHPGGPLALAFEVALNKQGFTGREISNPLTDSPRERVAATGAYLWKAWLPSAPWIPGSWYQTQLWEAAWGVKRHPDDTRPRSLLETSLSSVGVKARTQDVAANFANWEWRFNREERALSVLKNSIIRDYQRGAISRRQLDQGISRYVRKMRALNERRLQTFVGDRGE